MKARFPVAGRKMSPNIKKIKKCKEMYEISKGSYDGKILRVMSICKLKIHIHLPHLFYFVVSVAQNSEFERLKWFRLIFYHTLLEENKGVKSHFLSLQRQAAFHPEIGIARFPNQTPQKLKG